LKGWQGAPFLKLISAAGVAVHELLARSCSRRGDCGS
jgi:hypothetical protein